LNSLLHAFSVELPTVLSCDNFPNPDISQKTLALNRILAIYLTFHDNATNLDISQKFFLSSWIFFQNSDWGDPQSEF